MHVITQTRIWEAQLLYPSSESALENWYRIMRKNSFKNFAELKAVFNSVDRVGEWYIFNIGGNKLRLIADIQFDRQKVYIRRILNHKEYDLAAWKIWSH